MAKLAAKQQAWVDHYKQGRAAAQAARLAGYLAQSNAAFQTIGCENMAKHMPY